MVRVAHEEAVIPHATSSPRTTSLDNESGNNLGKAGKRLRSHDPDGSGLRRKVNRVRDWWVVKESAASGAPGNAIWGLSSHVTYMFLLFTTTPLMLLWLGHEGYGILVLVNSALGFAGAFDLGLTVSITKYVSTFLAKDQKSAVSEVISIGSWVFTGLGLVLALMVFAASPVLASLSMRTNTDMVPTAIVCFQIASFGVAARFIDSIGLSIIQGYHRYDVSSKLNLATNVSVTLVNLGIAYLDLGVVWCVVSVVFFVALGAVGKIVVAKRIAGSSNLWGKFRRSENFWRVFRFGFWGWIHGVAGMLAAQADKFLVSGLLGSRDLSIYAICGQVSQQIHSLPSSALAFLFPLSASIQELDRGGRLRGLYFNAQRFAISFGTFLGIPIGLMAFPFLSLWMGSDFAVTSGLTLTLFALYFTLLSTTIVPYNMLLGTGHVRLNTFFGVFGNLVMLGGMVLLIPAMGVQGAVWAKIISFSTGVVLFPILHARVLGDKRFTIGIRILAPIVVPFVLILWLAPLPVMAWPILILASGGVAVISATFSYVLCPRLPALAIRG